MIDVLMGKLGSPRLPGQRSRTKMDQDSFISLQNNLEARTCGLSYMQCRTGNTAGKQAAGDREYQAHSIYAQ